MPNNSIRLGTAVLTALAVTVPVSAQEARTVVVDGRSVRVRTVGLHHPADRPVVVFESGAGTGLDSWAPVLDEVGRFARAVAYDRAGIGLSESDDRPPAPRHVAQQLHRLLAQLGLRPPYVLVGHSWGGPLIRMFAALFPGEVAGMVYVDPTHLHTREQNIEYLVATGHSRDSALEDIARKRAQMAAFVRSRTGHYKAEMEIIQANEDSFSAEFHALPPPADVPVSVLMSGRFVPSVWTERPCEPRACHQHWLRYRKQWLTSLVPQARADAVTVVPESGHEIQRDAPAVVTAAIRRVLFPRQPGQFEILFARVWNLLKTSGSNTRHSVSRRHGTRP
jgi:pimeloyl-ACP methyl ester carboxylesterase